MEKALKDFAGLFVALAVVSAAACAPSSTQEAQKPSPSAATLGENTHPIPGLRLAASVSPGHVYQEDWILKIDRNEEGALYERHPNPRGWGLKVFTVAPNQQETILAAVEAANFFGLPGTLGPKRLRAGGNTVSLSIGLGDRTRTVYVFQTQSVTGTEVARFRRVWDAVKVVSPVPPPKIFR